MRKYEVIGGSIAVAVAALAIAACGNGSASVAVRDTGARSPAAEAAPSSDTSNRGFPQGSETITLD